MPIQEQDLIWIIIIGTGFILTFVGFFITTVITNQRRFIAVQREKLEESLRAEGLLRQIPGKILEGQEDERKRVARELHDGINQMLASVKYRLHTMKAISGDHPRVVRNITDLLVDLDKTMDEVKRISHNLHPKVLDELGFNAAVRSLCDQFTARTNILVHHALLSSTKDFTSKALELGMFRIVQEGLRNIEKHAHANEVWIAAIQTDSLITIEIRDNGDGFVPGNAGERKNNSPSLSGLGLHTMKERAALLGGTVDVHSIKDIGTTVLVKIPWKTTTEKKNPHG